MTRIYSVYVTENCDVKSFEYEVEDSYPLVAVDDLSDMKSLVLNGYKNIRNHKSAIWIFTDKDLATCFKAACKTSLSTWITEYEKARYLSCLKKMDSVFGLGGTP